MYRQLGHYCVEPEFETLPTASFACPDEPQAGVSAQQPACESESTSMAPPQVNVPKLLRTYLAIGARIGGPPAWDRAFGTIDFLTLLDLRMVSSSARHRFLAPLTQ